MSFFTLETIRQCIAPQHELSCSPYLWWRLLRALRSRGQNASRESGAFLIGNNNKVHRRIVDFVLYDDLDPHSLESGIVRFDGRYFSELWSQCKARDLTVVADIHVHPGAAGQSLSDKNHPMISAKGHIALILPSYARPPQKRTSLGIYVYRGNKTWSEVPIRQRCQFFHIGI